MSKLKSPTCYDCAIKAGWKARTEVFTISQGICANCAKETGVSTNDDYYKPGQKNKFVIWD